ncbi:hypothetical protein ScoT_26680 [Streptomyces albidoflavus]|uniref:Secreted protein n=2 Tax=Streptomyces TaxID=1883 RepID=A0AA37BYA3_9ACTN|nr:hypothetical protein ScoT_26680 [Streptomyces albidoflavus]
MIKRRAHKRIATIAGALSATTLLTVTQAAAVSLEIERATSTSGPTSPGSPWSCVRSGDNHTGTMVAQACWRTEGDWFLIHDSAKDGYSAVVDWESRDPQNRVHRAGFIFNAEGYASTVYKNKNYPEQNDIRFRACLGNWSTKKIKAGTCSGWITRG